MMTKTELKMCYRLETLQSLTSGLDSKSNKRCKLFDALLTFITMRQGENENDSAYMRRFRVQDNLSSSILGCHHYSSW